MKTFDDQKLQNLVRFNFYSTGSEEESIKKLMEKDETLTNEERNTLLTFLERNRYQKPLSINEMKREIFLLIGQPESRNSYSTTVNRAELEHIYNYILSTKK